MTRYQVGHCNIYYDNTSGSQNNEESEAIGLTRNIVTTAQPVPIVQIPVNHDESAQESEADAPSKQTRKPSHKVAKLLGGNRTLALGIQKPSDDWMAIVEACEDELVFATEVQEAEALEPRNLKEAMSWSDWPLWERAIEEELKVLKEAGTWEVVDVPKDANIVGLKWVFKAKKDASGNVIQYKACLIAQGFSQVPGVNYFDMFAPVAHLASIQTVLAFAAAEDYETGQIDIKLAYLNGELTSDEVIFMKQAPGYEVDSHEKRAKVYRLKKSLYGLKQAGHRSW